MLQTHLRANRLLAVSFIFALVALSALVAVPESQAAVKQPNCAKQKAKVRKSKGAKKRAAKRSLKQCINNRKVYRQIVDTRITGYRADGVLVDDLYCAKGKWQSDFGTGGKVYSRGWYVSSARFRSSKRFSAIVKAKIPGGTHEIAVARKGSSWQVGWSYFDEPQDLGDAKRVKSVKDCRKL